MVDRLAEIGTWAIVADPRAWLLILLLAGATLGRSGVFRSRWLDLLKPYRRRPAAAKGRPAAPKAEAPTHPFRDPWFLLLLVVSAAAVSTWIIMTMTASATRRP